MQYISTVMPSSEARLWITSRFCSSGCAAAAAVSLGGMMAVPRIFTFTCNRGSLIHHRRWLSIVRALAQDGGAGFSTACSIMACWPHLATLALVLTHAERPADMPIATAALIRQSRFFIAPPLLDVLSLVVSRRGPVFAADISFLFWQ